MVEQGAYNHRSLNADLIHILDVLLWSLGKWRVVEIIRVVLEFRLEFWDGSGETVMVDINSAGA